MKWPIVIMWRWKYENRRTRDFANGFDAGWITAMTKAEEVVRKHKPGVAVLHTSEELARKLNLLADTGC